ncbi:MAG: IspD/TarI family cytidylyltransferase [Ruminiclostridium sp.]
MITAIIFAGGTGERINSKTRPKQFLELHGKPILLYTIEHFERHPLIDNIAVVCIANWMDECRRLLEHNFIKKVKWIVPGGISGQESIYNGLEAIQDSCADDTIVLIHDGVRPLISEELITQNINMVREKNSAISIAYTTETVVTLNEKQCISDVPNRDYVRIAKAPQSFYYKDIWSVHKRARKEKVNNITDSATLMQHYGYELHTVLSSPYNVKITSPSDYYIFRALYEAIENSQIFGL